MTQDLLRLLIGTPPTGFEWMEYILMMVLAMLMVDAILKLFEIFSWFK